MYLFAPAVHQGSVQTLTYETHDYMKERQKDTVVTRNKKLHVYLPYGYDPAKQYDVLILMHGMGGTERYWLVDEQVYYDPPEEKVHTTDLLDNMIALGTAREMIVVTPTFYNNSDKMNDYQRNREQDQFVYELRRDILPLIVKNFSTYAVEPTEEAISAAREHFAYAGLSMGSMYAYTSVIPDCLDLFAWFGCFSGSDGDMPSLAEQLNRPPLSEYPIRYFYNSIGTSDSFYSLHWNQYHDLVWRCDGLSEGENAAFTEYEALGHTYTAWSIGLYNFLPLLFAER
jgi:enterochelin esterase-like enzyme